MYQKRWLHFAGLSIPGIVDLTTRERVMVETSQGKRIPAIFADMITLREPNPDGANAGGAPYLRQTNENLFFTSLRKDADAFAGLDFDAETGEVLTYAALDERRAADITARQLQRQQAAAPAEVSLDDALSVTDPSLDAATA